MGYRTYCSTEKMYLNFKCRNNRDRLHKAELRSNFIQAQKHFDKRFRFFKRKHKAADFEELEKLATSGNPDIWKKLKLLCDPNKNKVLLEILRDDETVSTDKKEVLQRWYDDISALFSGLRDDPSNAFDDIFYSNIESLKSEFDSLDPQLQAEVAPTDGSSLNTPITYNEVLQIIEKAKLHKAFLSIPNEAMKNDTAKLLLFKLFSICFTTGLCPSEWYKSDIKPIPKKDKDKRIPLNNRCITIMCCVAKIYSSILNARLQKYLEANNLLVDEQNGFRAARSCVDHLFTLCTILRNRKSLNLQSFVCFVDYTRAFDSVDRVLLLYKLSRFGIHGHMYNAISALYKDPRARVTISQFSTDWFECSIGVKQGDTISPTLFAIFVNDLADELKRAGLGINITNDVSVSCLFYADDIILLAESEEKLQDMLSIVDLWCKKWRLDVNLTKTNVMHVRKKHIQKSRFVFILGNKIVNYCSSYRYLGNTLNEYLNFEFTTQIQAENAGRALGMLQTKMIKNGGFPLKVFDFLYAATVCAVSDYGSEVWGGREYPPYKNYTIEPCVDFLE